MDSLVLTADSPRDAIALHGGSKALGLRLLTDNGFNVPEWAVVGQRAFRSVAQRPAVAELLSQVRDPASGDNLANLSAAITVEFDRAVLSDEVSSAILSAYEHVGASSVAVRSSGTNEDGAEASFAGQYSSFLNVTGDAAVLTAVRHVWASAFSQRALSYKLLHDLPLIETEMAVVLQAMVDADLSGVLFTVNPVNKRPDEMIVSAISGLGEGLVSGRSDADTFVVPRSESANSIGSQRAEISSLTPGQLDQICSIGRKVEAVLERPQDIEWAIAGDQLWLLQSRPITSAVFATGTQRRIWDNSNIVESYGDVSSPLTFSFARLAYERVYTEYCRLLGVPRRDWPELRRWLPNMLAYFDGRVYYNLFNWYRLIGLLPFYNLHRRMLELSLGVSASLDDATALELRPLKRASRFAQIRVRARMALRFGWFFFTIERSAERFVRRFNSAYQEFDAIDFAEEPAEELYELLETAEERLLSLQWGRMIVLESVLGLSIGALHTLTQRWIDDAPAWLLWDLVKSDEQIESAVPAEQLNELARQIHDRPGLRALLDSLPVGAEMPALEIAAKGTDAGWLLDAIRAFFVAFGYRNLNELKLEEPDLNEQPEVFFALLRQAVELESVGGRWPRPSPHESGEAILDSALRGPRRLIYRLVRNKVRRALAERERVRLCRTRLFGVTRRLFRAIGEDLARFGAIEHSSDVFQLRLEELRGSFDGTLSHRELKPLIELRKTLFAAYQTESPGPRFETVGPPYWTERTSGEVADEPADIGAELSGVACGAGEAEGIACVTNDPANVNGEILVAYRTDPGWVTALGSTRALVIERGSPLTHVAVVARELGIPTITQVPNATKVIQSGMQIKVNGTTGKVTIQSGAVDDE